MKRREKELRCFCRNEPLLATYGMQDDKVYVHIKVYKGNRIYSESVHTDGTVKIKCRNCLKWYTINVDNAEATLRKTQAPEALSATI